MRSLVLRIIPRRTCTLAIVDSWSPVTETNTVDNERQIQRLREKGTKGYHSHLNIETFRLQRLRKLADRRLDQPCTGRIQLSCARRTDEWQPYHATNSHELPSSKTTV